MPRITSSRGARRLILALALSAAVAAVAGVVSGVDREAEAASYATAPAYRVVQEGLTQDEAARLADAFGVDSALEPNGAFSYVSPSYAEVPSQKVAEGRDEQGNPTLSEALDYKALDAVKPISSDDALARAEKLLDVAGLSPDFGAKPHVSHSQLTIADREGRTQLVRPLDTAVSYHLTLGGLPATGQGAKLRITFAPDGSVSQLSDTLRKVEQDREVPIISEEDALAGCAALYGKGTQQGGPTLGYYLPELTAKEASGDGSVRLLCAYSE